jgi:hypothetical protein
MAIAYTIACAIYRAQANQVCIITSGAEGPHMVNSLHPLGKALDFRIRTLTTTQQQTILLALRAALGAQFDVVLEKTHIHCEFDPKEPEQVPIP